MNILMIWQEIPENISLYLFNDTISMEERHDILASHGLYINGNAEQKTNPEIFRVNLMLGGMDSNNKYEQYRIYQETDKGAAILNKLTEIQAIVVTGFML